MQRPSKQQGLGRQKRFGVPESFARQILDVIGLGSQIDRHQLKALIFTVVGQAGAHTGLPPQITWENHWTPPLNAVAKTRN